MNEFQDVGFEEADNPYYEYLSEDHTYNVDDFGERITSYENNNRECSFSKESIQKEDLQQTHYCHEKEDPSTSETSTKNKGFNVRNGLVILLILVFFRSEVMGILKDARFLRSMGVSSINMTIIRILILILILRSLIRSKSVYQLFLLLIVLFKL